MPDLISKINIKKPIFDDLALRFVLLLAYANYPFEYARNEE